MAEPISIAASIFTLLGACRASTRLAVDTYNRIQNAPQELIATSNELADLSVILLQIRKIYQLDPGLQSPSTESMNHDVDTVLAVELNRAKELVADLDTLVTSLKKSLPGGKFTTDRIGWYRKKNTADKIGGGIKSAKTNLHFLLSIKMR